MVTTVTVITTLPIVTYTHRIEDDLVTRCSNFFNVGFLLKLNGYDRREARLQWISTTATMLTTGTVVTTLPIVTKHTE